MNPAEAQTLLGGLWDNATGPNVSALLELAGGLLLVWLLQLLLRFGVERWGRAPARRPLALVVGLGLQLFSVAVGFGLVVRFGWTWAPTLTGLGVLVALFGVGYGLVRLVPGWLGAWVLILQGRLRIGDHLEVSGVDGVVEGLGLTRVRLRTESGARVIVPASALSEASLTISTLEQTVPVELVVSTRTPVDPRTLDNARRLVRLCPYRSWQAEVSVAEEGPSSLRIRFQAWSPTAAEAAQAFIRDGLR